MGSKWGITTCGIYIASYMEQAASRLTLSDLAEANKILKELNDLEPTITYNKELTLYLTWKLYIFGRVIQHNHRKGLRTKRCNYGDTRKDKDGRRIFHLIDLASKKAGQSFPIRS